MKWKQDISDKQIALLTFFALKMTVENLEGLFVTYAHELELKVKNQGDHVTLLNLYI